MMSKTLPNGMLCNAITDEDAPRFVDVLVANMGSQFLSDTVATEFDFGGRKVLMRDHINLLLTLEHPPNKLVAFILAELEHEARLVRFHVLYVLRLYRKQGFARLILAELDRLVSEAGYETVMAAPSTHRAPD